MANNVLQVEIKATLSGLTEGLKAANEAVAQTSQKMRGDLAGIGSSAKEGSGGVISLADALKAHKAEVRAEGGMTRVLARDLAVLGLDAKGAGGEIAHLVSSLAFGGGLGAAVAVVGMIAKAWKESAEAAAKAREEFEKAWESLRPKGSQPDEILAKQLGTEKSKALMKEWKRLEDEIAEVQKGREGDAQRAALAGLQLEEYRSTLVTGLEKQLVRVKERIREVGGVAAAAELRQNIESAINAPGREEAGKKATEQIEKQNKEREKLAEESRNRQEREEIASRNESDRWEAEYLKKRDAERLRSDEEEARRTRQRADDEAANYNALGLEVMRIEQRKYAQQQHAAERYGEKVGGIMAQVAQGTITPMQAIRAIMADVVSAVGQAAIKTVMGHAAGAAAGAAESQASVPFIGPILAASAMSAMLALVMGLIGGIPSAAGGWQIPAGVNPILQAHAGEHVIPADIAQKYEEGAPGGSGQPTIIIQAFDSRSIERWFRAKTPAALIKTLADTRRNRRTA